MVLVLLGACYQDLNKEEATKCLKRAITFSENNQLLALQGLVSCAPAEEVPGFLVQLLKLQP